MFRHSYMSPNSPYETNTQRSWTKVISPTITIMPTGSRGQQQLATAAQQLPTLDRFGYRYDASLSHPRVTAIRIEKGLDDIGFSSGRQDDIATSSPFTPLLQIWTYHRRDQPNTGPSHLNIFHLIPFSIISRQK